MLDFSGRGAMVTGAGRGIGQACALALGQAGASVVVSDINMDALEETVAELRKSGARVEAIPADIGDPARVAELIGQAIASLGKLDAAVNCAAVYDRSAADDWDGDDFDWVMRINVRGVYSCLRGQIAHMVERGGGAIVNVASTAGLRGGRSLGYGTSKHAIVGLTRSTALIYAQRGVRINALCPGPTDTQMLRDVALVNPAAPSGAGSIPIGRRAAPREIAQAAVWLCSDAASYVTGAAIPVDGGVTAG